MRLLQGATTVDQRKFDVEYQTQTLNACAHRHASNDPSSTHPSVDIYDYLRKQNLNQTATCLLNEGSFPVRTPRHHP